MFPRVVPVGDAAFSLEWGDSIDDAVNARVRAVDEAVRRQPFPGFVESVPTHRSLLVLFDPERISLASAAQAALAEATAAAPTAPASRHVVPVVYGGESGPDLERVARLTGLPSAEIVARHASVEYTARMLGFLPGFAYLGPLDAALAAPRLETPRTRVPAGSVAIADRETAIYPAASAGGWNLIGRTSLRLFDPHASPPCRIAAGDRVRFEAVATLASLEPTAATPVLPEASLEVVSPGVLTSVQDLGRPGYRRFGVATSGAADRGALVRANAAVGNRPQAAALECTLVGPRVRFLASALFAVVGAELGAVLGRATVPLGVPTRAAPGDELAFTGRRDGCRAYVAFAGGIDVPRLLGARATHLQAGFGGHLGRTLRRGDRLAIARETTTQSHPVAGTRPSDVVTVRVVPGPQDDAFAPDAMPTLLSEEWRVASDSDRAGLRLEGPALSHRGASEIVSDGVVPGCIQVPADGRPIVVLWDGPTTGGYAKLATVVRADLDRLAQLMPGVGRVRFVIA